MSSRPSAFTLTQPGRLRLFSTKELVAMPPPEFQIDKMFLKGGFCVLYGPPGAYKSFVAADMGCAIASRIGDWQGLAAEPGHVLYVAAEGGSGMGKRIGGWATAHDVDPARIDISWLLESFPMQADSEDMSRLLERLMEIDTQPALIIIDTLARCYIGDENKQEDMNAFIAGVDQLRGELKCTVMVVHHTRLDGDRERGNTALRGAADSMIAVTGTERGDVRTVTLSNDKQKDEAKSDGMRFGLTLDKDHNTLVMGSLTPSTSADRLLVTLRSANVPLGSVMSFGRMKLVTSWHSQQLKRALDVTIANGKIAQQNDKYRLIKW